MKLPYRSHASIPNEKLTRYILSENHVVGKFKAKFFRDLGFDESNISLFKQALKTVARTEQVKEDQSSEYGIKYLIEGKIETPSGETIKVRTVWIIEKGQKIPRFVTVYPV